MPAPGARTEMKNFGQEGDYLIKVEQKENDGNKIIPQIKENLSENLKTEINFRRVENVGPKVSSELLQSGIIAISLSLAAMLFYIWIRFEWQFSIGSIIALFHDVVITLGIFSVLSLEINLSIIAAVLTIVGYSMNDTVVIYDRIRENLNKHTRLNISDLANLSINETLSRTVITSLTTLLFAKAFSALPEGLFQVVTGEAPAGKFLVEHPDTHMIAFTGSVPVGVGQPTMLIENLTVGGTATA